MYTIVWRNRSDLDTISLDDVYNYLKVYEPEVQKKSESNSQNMAFISLAKNSSGNGELNTASTPTASTQVSPDSANIKYEDINQIDKDDIEEIDIKWNMALPSMRADRFWKKTGKKISIQGTDVVGFDKSKVECFNCHKMGHFSREYRAPRSQDRGRRENYKQGSKEEEQAPKALMVIDEVGWDWSYMANKEENHALVADEEAPTEFSLMAKSSSNSEVFDNFLYFKSCKKNTDSLNSKITELSEKLSDTKTNLYHYKLGLSHVVARLVEFKNQEIKFCEKIRGLEFKVESKTNRIECLTNELEKLKKEKEGLDSKLTRFQSASKDLDTLLGSQRSDKNKEGLRYSVVPPPAQVYSPLKKDMSWTGLPEFVDDIITDYSRPSPSIEKNFPLETQKVSTANLGNKGKAINASACWIWKPKQNFNGNSQDNIDDKGYWDNGCSRYMTGNISYLSNYEPYVGGFVSFRQGSACHERLCLKVITSFILLLLAFCDYHNMIAILDMYEHNINFHPIVDFVEASYIRQYTRRARIAQSLALLTAADVPASPFGDDSQGQAFPTISGLEAKQDRANIFKTSTLPHDSTPMVTSLATNEGSMQHQLNELTDLCTRLQRQQTEMASKLTTQDLEIASLKARIKMLEEKDGGVAEPSGEDATIKGKSLEIGEEAGVDKSTERGSNEIEELVNVLTSLDAASILTSGGVQVVSVPLAVEVSTVSVPTGSGLVPTASLVFTTASMVTPYSRQKGKEKMLESDTPKKKKLQEQIYVQVVREMEEQLAREDQRRDKQIARDAEITIIHAEEELQMLIDGLDRNNETVAKYLQEQLSKSTKVPVSAKKAPLKEATKRVQYVSTEEPCWVEDQAFQGEDLNQLWTLVKETLSIRQDTSDNEKELWVELKRLFEPDVEHQLWTYTQALMRDQVEWRLYDSCGVHHVLSIDQEIYMLVERE
uniref:Uncharacterized protein n=1 Tax=Tanacetum cinerariifolium TaxID=118510 RepID=A0A6L2JG79_TANCI|nr:hypothetical protein [Tanacetum cinerariifolium]